MATRIESTLPDLLRVFREGRGLTLDELAELVQERRTTVLRWETGTARPSQRAAEKLEAIGVGPIARKHTNHSSISEVQRVAHSAGSRSAAAAHLRSAARRRFAYGGEAHELDVPPYVVNGPPDQGSFHDRLLALQEVTDSPVPWGVYRERLSLVEAVDGEPTSQFRLEAPKPTASSWNSNYGSHGWHRYVGRFPPHLVRVLLNHFGASADTTLLDPFAGSGTALVECRLLGIKAIGVELSPLSALMSSVKSRFPDDGTMMREAASRLEQHIARRSVEIGLSRGPDMTHPEIAEATGHVVPAFANYERWFTPEAYLGVALTVEFALTLDGYERDAVLVALSGKMRSIGNVDVDVVRAEYRNEPRKNVDVLKLVCAQLRRMAGDIDGSYVTHATTIGPPGSIDIVRDSVLDVELEPESVDCIITSPPYGVESLSYLRTHLLSYRSLSSVFGVDPYADDRMIGSEYLGDASNALRDHPELAISPSLVEFFSGLESSSLRPTLRARESMMIQFFVDMVAVVQRMTSWLRPGGRVAFVVGNKTIGDRVIPTDAGMTEIFASCGISIEDHLRHKLKTNNSNSQVPWQERTIQEEVVLIGRKA